MIRDADMAFSKRLLTFINQLLSRKPCIISLIVAGKFVIMICQSIKTTLWWAHVYPWKFNRVKYIWMVCVKWSQPNHSNTQESPTICIIPRTTSVLLHSFKCIFYHDVDEIFWPQPVRSLKLGHVTGQGSKSPTWVGQVSDPGKMDLIKSVKTWIILLYIWLHL